MKKRSGKALTSPTISVPRFHRTDGLFFRLDKAKAKTALIFSRSEPVTLCLLDLDSLESRY